MSENPAHQLHQCHGPKRIPGEDRRQGRRLDNWAFRAFVGGFQTNNGAPPPPKHFPRSPVCLRLLGHFDFLDLDFFFLVRRRNPQRNGLLVSLLNVKSVHLDCGEMGARTEGEQLGDGVARDRNKLVGGSVDGCRLQNVRPLRRAIFLWRLLLLLLLLVLLLLLLDLLLLHRLLLLLLLMLLLLLLLWLLLLLLLHCLHRWISNFALFYSRTS
mmetsp:Transcript_16068/g.32141  ORF Transcript_16068/g.32141 Transcript_16068/m.32141 type:complete len:213 (-) Transcript_16068:170-808(-)